MDEQTLRLECVKMALDFASVYGRDKDMTDIREFAEELFSWARTLGDDLPRYRGPGDSTEQLALLHSAMQNGQVEDSEETKVVARAVGQNRKWVEWYETRAYQQMANHEPLSSGDIEETETVARTALPWNGRFGGCGHSG